MGGEQKCVRSILIKCYDTLEAVEKGEITFGSVSSEDQLEKNSRTLLIAFFSVN